MMEVKGNSAPLHHTLVTHLALRGSGQGQATLINGISLSDPFDWSNDRNGLRFPEYQLVTLHLHCSSL